MENCTRRYGHKENILYLIYCKIIFVFVETVENYEAAQRGRDRYNRQLLNKKHSEQRH